MLPPDWRERFTAMVRGEIPSDSGWFQAGPVLDAAAQIAVYQEQYRLRMDDAMPEDLPGLSAMLGEDATLALCRAWLLEHPPRSWTLTDLVNGFADWLEARGEPAGVVDMARLDEAVARGFTAAAPAPLTSSLQADLRLRLSPPTSLLVLRTNAHQLRTAHLLGDTPPDLVETSVSLVLYRAADLGMRHRELEAGLAAMLGALPCSVEAMVEAALADASSPITGEQIAGWFKQIAALGLVEPG